MSALVLKFEQRDVRVLRRDDGELLWFVLADVCRELEIANPADVAAKQLDDDEKGVDTIYTPGGAQSVIIVSEAGFYKLSFASRKPNAKRFVRWVTHEVLPEIRRTGGYHGTALIEQIADLLSPLERIAAATHDNVVALRQDVRDLGPKRWDFSTDDKDTMLDVVVKFKYGRCPCCNEVEIVDVNSAPIEKVYEHDHWYARNRAKLHEGWPVCCECNQRLASDTEFKKAKAEKFNAFQVNVQDYLTQQARARAMIVDRSRSDERAMTSDEWKALKQTKLLF